MEKFSQLEYARPNMEAARAAFQAALDRFEAAATYEEARAAYLECDGATLDADTLRSIAHIRNTLDTTDEFYDKEMEYFNEEGLKILPLSKRFLELTLTTPFRAEFEREFGRHMFDQAELNKKTKRPEIMEDLVQEGKLTADYRKATAKAKTIFRGRECNFYGLLKHMESEDRMERKEAFEAWAELYERISPELDEIFSQLVKVRDTMAKKLGFPSYTELAYLNRGRMDYTPEDAAKFRRQVLNVIVPAVDELRKRQAERIGVDKLSYYDENFLLPGGNADPVGGEDALIPIALKMYREMSPQTEEFFTFMTDYELFDLTTRPGKHMGGYCSRLPKYKAPFIFSNFNGTAGDARVLTHEAGHAFAGYTASRKQILRAYESSTSEINEIHSMSMEYFAYPWMKDFFGEDKEADAKYAHMMGELCNIPYMVCVDEFQHRVYERPEMTAMERRAVWRELEQKYLPWRDYDTNAFLEEGGFWMQKQHIFMYPFYYIEYALAQVCSQELYGRMKEDPSAAWSDYLRLCEAGGSLGYFELLKLANLSNPFEAGTVQKSTAHVIAELMA